MHSEKGFVESFNFFLFIQGNFSPTKQIKSYATFAATRLADSLIKAGQNVSKKRKDRKETSKVDPSFVN